MVIILDTNVISESMKQKPDANVAYWLSSLHYSETQTTAINEAELRYGIACLPNGKRKMALERAFETLMRNVFRDRVLPFNADSSYYYAIIAAKRKAAGKPISTADTIIAAICLQHKAILATRNSKDFAGLGISLINPWENA